MQELGFLSFCCGLASASILAAMPSCASRYSPLSRNTPANCRGNRIDMPDTVAACIQQLRTVPKRATNITDLIRTVTGGYARLLAALAAHVRNDIDRPRPINAELGHYRAECDSIIPETHIGHSCWPRIRAEGTTSSPMSTSSSPLPRRWSTRRSSRHSWRHFRVCRS